MSVALITGSCGLIGSEAVLYFGRLGFDIIGIDNDMRAYFLGAGASTKGRGVALSRQLKNYTHFQSDVRDHQELDKIFARYQENISLIIHAAAQPSHDWAAREPMTDFYINAAGTLHMLECARRYCPGAVFIFLSTNKVYGDTPNQLPFEELPSRWELPEVHALFTGVTEEMSIDHSKHSLFGASKLSADILVQEYGRYFGMKTVCFRGGCMTGGHHAGARLHGFLSYLGRCAVLGKPYTVIGYKGKQVRDNIHSLDMVRAFEAFYRDPKQGAVYNIGGGRGNSCSVIEAIALYEKLTTKKMEYTIEESPRSGDHQWYISDSGKFCRDYPSWKVTIDLNSILEEIIS